MVIFIFVFHFVYDDCFLMAQQRDVFFCFAINENSIFCVGCVFFQVHKEMKGTKMVYTYVYGFEIVQRIYMLFKNNKNGHSIHRKSIRIWTQLHIIKYAYGVRYTAYQNRAYKKQTCTHTQTPFPMR